MVDLTNIGQNILSTGSTVGATVLVVLIICLFLVPLFIGIIILVYLSQFKHKIQIREKTEGNTDRVFDEKKFRVVRRHGQDPQIQVLSGFKYHPYPPSAFIDVREKNGKMFVVAYRDKEGRLEYVNVNNNINATEYEIDQDFYFRREKRAKEKYQKENIWSFLAKATPFIVIVLVLGMVFVFWQDIFKPILDFEEQRSGHDQTIKEITENQARIMGDLARTVQRMEQLTNTETLPERNLTG